MSEEEYNFYCKCAPRLDMFFTSLYQTAWTGKYKNNKEKQVLVLSYIRVIRKMGGINEARKVMRYLDSGLNTKNIDFPPTPLQFLTLKYEIPKEFKKNKTKLPKISEITKKARIYSGILKMIVGANVTKSHSDVIDLLKYNYEKYQEHIKKNGLPFMQNKKYHYYEVDLRGESNKWNKKTEKKDD